MNAAHAATRSESITDPAIHTVPVDGARRDSRVDTLDPVTLPSYDFGKVQQMVVKITSKRQVTFPARVLKALGVEPGDRLELIEGPDGFVLRPRRIDPSRLAPLRSKLSHAHRQFDLEAFREETYDPALRD